MNATQVLAIAEAEIATLEGEDGPLASDTEAYHQGELAGWRTVKKILEAAQADRTPAQALYTMSGHWMDETGKPKTRSLWDNERGFMGDNASHGWSLSWNRVIYRAMGLLEATCGMATYENSKDLPTPPLQWISSEDDPVLKKDLDESVERMLGKPRRTSEGQ